MKQRRSTHAAPSVLIPPKAELSPEEPPLSARWLFLLMMATVVFGAFTLFVATEILQHRHRLQLVEHMATQDDTDVRRAAVWVLVFAVPVTSIAAWFPLGITHVSSHGISLRSPVLRASPVKEDSVTQGNRYFRIYQTAAWTLYLVFLAMVVACMASDLPVCGFGYRSCMTVAAFLAEALVISSVLALEHHPNRNNRPTKRGRAMGIVHNYSNMLLLVGAIVLAGGSEYVRSTGVEQHYSLSSGLGSLALVTTATFNTYGLGGLLSMQNGWRFYQPFMGGTKYVCCQMISWTCFGVGVFLQGLYLLSLVIVEMELFVGAVAIAGLLFVISEVVMMASLMVFKDSPKDQQQSVTPSEQQPPSSVNDRLKAFAQECLGAVVVSLLVNVQWIPGALIFVLFATCPGTDLSPQEVVVYGFLAVLLEFFFVASRSITIFLQSRERPDVVKNWVYHAKYGVMQVVGAGMPAAMTVHLYMQQHDAWVPFALLTAMLYMYVSSYRGQPEQSGHRMRKSWVFGQSRLMDIIESYFSGQVIRMAELDPNQPYIMAFHPHGIMAVSVMWLQFTNQWRTLFPDFHAHILTASILHQIPLARDVLQFYGGREVTKAAFVATLKERHSVMLVPGGQSEMLEQRARSKQVRVHTGHKGFVRLAIEHGVPLVPVLSFKEGETLDNIRAPVMQKWSVKTLAFPFPYFPYGRGLLPIPRKMDMTIVVGEPMQVKQIESPSMDDVNKVHEQYYAKITDMFHKYKHQAGCDDYELVLI